MGVDLRTGVTATGLDLRRRVVHFRDETGAVGQLAFDLLVLATGASAVIPAWARDGHRMISGVHPVKDLDDGAPAPSLPPGPGTRRPAGTGAGSARPPGR
jgi:NADPH-dependent 2,4-dienoyl-CoA reductase/sulfur reductase-like enzyme